MPRRIAVVLAALVAAACSRTNTPPAADSAAVAKRSADSVLALRTQQAPAMADSARSVLKVLLKRPETAVFDSVTVVQPPEQDGAWPMPYVCGRIGGKPGIGAKNVMTPFVYQNRLTVFVLDPTNGPAFASLRAKACDNPAARVLFR